MISTILTIIFYFVVYSITTLIFKVANDSVSVRITKRYIAIGIMIMALVACLRDVAVGTDTQNTITLYFCNQIDRNITAEGIFGFLNSDIPYYVLSNVLHFLHLGENAFLFVMELLILIPMGIVAYKKRELIPIHLTMLIFSLLYYQIGFNWIRQSSASAFTLLALIYFQEKKTKKAVILSLAGIMIHASAIIGISLLLYPYAFMRIKNKFTKAIFGIVFMAFFLYLISRWENLFSFAIQSGILPTRFSGYFRVFSGQTRVENWFRVGKKAYVEYIIRVLIVSVPIFVRRKQKDESEIQNINYYKIISVMGLIIYSYVLFAMHSAYGNRISYAIEYVQILTLGYCCVPHISKRGRVPLRNILVVGLIATYNIWLYYVLGWHDTVPFIFGLGL